jgi:hypothetical protein
MTKGETFAEIKHLAPEDQRAFNRWLQGCAVVGSILGIGLVAMAVAGLRTPESKTASEQTRSLSFQNQHELAHVENLPVQQIEDLTHIFVRDPLTGMPASISSSGRSAKR